MAEGTWVGLDVHARSVVAGVIDVGSGELRTLRVPVGSAEAVEWLRSLPAPVRVAYEAGPTGYGLARACAAAGIACTVGGAVEDSALLGRSGEDGSARRREVGQVVAAGRAGGGAGARPARGGGARFGAGSRGRPVI